MKARPIRGSMGVLLLMCGFVLLVVCTGVQAKTFPNEDYIDWNYDVNLNRIDDRLEAMAPSDTVDGVVLYNRCVTMLDSLYMATLATVDYKGEYVQGIWVSDITVADLTGMVSDPTYGPDVFRVEYCDTLYAVLDVSCRAIKARPSATYSPNTAWDNGFTGAGSVIAILDTGVDDGHPAFAGKLVAACDCYTWPYWFINPDDDNIGTFHGTHVAGIALGVDPAGIYHGVASGASLVDVKVLTGAGWGTWAAYQRGMGFVIATRRWFGTRVINLSLGNATSCNGKCANCMAVDAAVDKGLTVCVAAGNSGGVGWMPCPAAADRAITVGAVDDQATVIRNDEVHAPFSNAGPRVSDNDDDTIDEEKPDVVAPGVTIMAPLGIDPGQSPLNLYHNMTGTSMACPHVAGVAAILDAAKPFGFTPDGVKAILRRTSTDAAQNVNPVWSPTWGKGEVDAYEATRGMLPADLYIRSDEIYTTSRPQAGVTTTIKAKIRNRGPNNATGVVVNFYTNSNTIGFSGWVKIGQDVINIPVGGMTIAQAQWTPVGGHQCIKVEVIYCGDGSVIDNTAYTNFDPKQSEFSVEVGTPFTDPTLLRLNIDSNGLLAEEGWTAKIWSEDDLFDTLFIDTRDTFDRYMNITDDKCPRIVRADIYHPEGADSNDYSILVLQGWVDTLMVGQQTFLCAVQLQSSVNADETPFGGAISLEPNYPNPFSPRTTLSYSLPRSGHVRLEIYDVHGRRVAGLVDELQTPGSYSETWDGLDEKGIAASTGVYFARLEAPGGILTRKMMLLR